MSSPAPSPVPQPTISHDRPDDTIRILLATDNHIGYLERDPVRGQDSINAFREILQLAVQNEVDMIVLAGDLFHENRPSRDVLYETTALLREYTMGNKPVEFEVISDPTEGQAAGFSFPAINTEDGNYNISIPVFSIHGNHDDPQGTGPEGALCALDLLSVTGLVNYIGKMDLPTSDETAEQEGLLVKPVLLRKGATHLALYGIGNVKDNRMHYELRSNRVRMFMPEDGLNWFNMLLIHQNRVKHGPQESVPETMFDERVNLVVWGHEHDCRIVPEPVAGKDYMITQPGSSVATSLAEGESQTKHVALVEILDGEFELHPLPLRTVRPFVMDAVELEEVRDTDGLDLTDKMEINKYLKRKVEALIQRAKKEREDASKKAVLRGEEPLEPMLPLVRLKVDTTGVPDMSNPVRFGQEFHGKVANPRDILSFTRSRAGLRARKTVTDAPDLEDLIDPDAPNSEKFAKVRVSALVNQYLKAQNLELLAENGMSNAVMNYVDKDDTHAISDFVAKTLKGMQKGIQVNAASVDEYTLDEEFVRLKEQQVQQFKDTEQDEEEEEEEEEAPKKKLTMKAKGKTKKVQESDEDSMLIDDDDFADMVPAKKTTAAKGRTAATKAKATSVRAQGKKELNKLFEDSDDEEEEVEEVEEEEEPPKAKGKKAAPARRAAAQDDDEEEDVPKAKPKKASLSRAAVLDAAPAKKAPGRKNSTSTPAASSKKQTSLSFAPSQRPTGRAAANKARGKIQEEALQISSDEE